MTKADDKDRKRNGAAWLSPCLVEVVGSEGGWALVWRSEVQAALESVAHMDGSTGDKRGAKVVLNSFFEDLEFAVRVKQ